MTPHLTTSEFADDQHRLQAEELLLEQGRFCVAFERVCEAMRHSIVLIFLSEGLMHEGLAQVVVGDKGSAELQVLLGALFSELRNRYEVEDQRAVQGLLKEIMDLTEARNLVVHSAWRFGKNAAFAEFYATAIRPRTKQKKGAVPEIQGVSAKYLLELTARANALELKLKELHKCILQSSLKVSVQLRN